MTKWYLCMEKWKLMGLSSLCWKGVFFNSSEGISDPSASGSLRQPLTSRDWKRRARQLFWPALMVTVVQVVWMLPLLLVYFHGKSLQDWTGMWWALSFPRKCVHSCPPGYFGDSVQRKCRKCYRGCEACLGRSQNLCIACKRGFYHHQDTNTCVILCPAGFYSDDGEEKKYLSTRGVSWWKNKS